MGHNENRIYDLMMEIHPLTQPDSCLQFAVVVVSSVIWRTVVLSFRCAADNGSNCTPSCSHLAPSHHKFCSWVSPGRAYTSKEIPLASTESRMKSWLFPDPLGFRT